MPTPKKKAPAKKKAPSKKKPSPKYKLSVATKGVESTLRFSAKADMESALSQLEQHVGLQSKGLAYCVVTADGEFRYTTIESVKSV